MRDLFLPRSPSPGRSLAAAVAAWLTLTVVVGPAEAQLLDLKLLIADVDARPSSEHPAAGALFLQSTAGDSSTVFVAEPPLTNPYAVDVDAEGRILLIDRGYDVPGTGGQGALFRLDPFDRTIELTVGDDRFVALTDVDELPDGRILLVDREANPLGLSQPDTGALFAVDPVTGEVSVFASPPELIDPVGVEVDSLGHVYVIDQNADPLGLGTDTGAVFELDPADGSVIRLVSASPDYSNPVDAVRVGSHLYLVDATAFVRDRYSGNLFEVDLDTGEVREYLVFVPYFGSLADIVFLDGLFYMLDKDIDFGEGTSRGGLYVINPATRRQNRLASSAMWSDPRSLAFLPNARVGLPTHDLVDLDGDALNPGDEVEIVLGTQSLVSIGAAYTVRDTLPVWLRVDPGSLAPSSGSASLEGTETDVVVWTDATEPGGSAELRFRATVLPTERVRQPLISTAVLVDEGGGSFRSVRTDTAYRPLLPTEIVFSDPLSFFVNGQIAVARGDGSEVEIIVDRPDSLDQGGIVNPTGITVDIAGDIYFVDPGTSIPPDTEARGAVFRYRPLAGEVDVFATDPTWRDPSSIAAAPNGDLVVLDTGSALDGGVGTVHRLDPATGQTLSSVTDPRWLGPQRVAVTSGNEILVVDRLSTVGGFAGGRRGAVFRIDETGTVTVDLAVFQFENLGGIAPFGFDRYFIADNARKRIYVGGGDTPFEDFLLIPTVSSVTGMTLSRSGDLLVLDGPNATVYRVDLETPSLNDPLAQSELLFVPTALATPPSARFEGSQWVVYDVNGGAIVPGDRLVAILQVRNTGTRNEPDARIVGQIPPLVDVDPGSFVASQGDLVYDPATRTMEWRGPLLLGELVNLTYASEVSAGAGMGSLITNHADVLPTAGVPWSLSDTQVVRGPLVAGDVLVVDPDLPDLGGGPGGLGRRDYASSALDVLFRGSPLVHPVAVAADGNRLPLVLDRDADPLGLGSNTGALFRYDPVEDDYSVVIASPVLRNPVDIEVAPDGTVYILDADAEPGGGSTNGGALFALPPGGGALTTVATDPRFREPVGIALAADGSLLLLDRDALPLGGADGAGALFRVVPSTGAVTALMTGEGWREVSAVALHGDGSILVADRAADPDSLLGGQGAVFRVNPGDLSMARYLVDDELLEPVDLGLNAAGEVVVLDQGDGASPPNLWGVNEFSGTVRAFWRPPGTVSPAGIAFLPGSKLAGSHIRVVDRNGGAVRPGDLLDYAVVLENAAEIEAEPVVVTVPIPEGASLESGSIDPGPGSASFDGTTVIFALAVPADGSTEVAFALRVDADLDPGTPVGVVAEIDAGNGVLLSILDQQRIPHELGPGDLLVLDRLAPPDEPERGSGTLFAWLASDGDARPVSSLPPFTRLEAVAVDPSDPGASFLVDSGAGSAQEGRDTGAVFEIGTHDGRLRRTYLSEDFAGPVSLFFDLDGTPIVVDFSADPMGTGSPRGALFRLDRATGTVALDVTHPSFAQPRHGTARADGTYLVVDRAADPTGLGGNVGTVFAVNPTSGVVSVARTGGLLVDPVWIVPYASNSYVIVDEGSDPAGLGGDTGALLEYFPGTGLVRALATSPDFILPSSARVGMQGEVYVAERALDPDLGPGRGVILRYHPGDGLVTRHVESDRFRAPVGVDFVSSPTPVRSITLSGRDEAHGVVLDWDVVWTGPLHHADVYRAPAHADLSRPRPEDLLTPDGLDPTTRRYVDPTAEVGDDLVYWVGLTEADGTSTISGSVRLRVIGGAPRVYALGVPRPNPFASRTAVAFDVPVPGGRVQVEVFDPTGRRVRVLETSHREPGRHRLVWDGRTDAGHPVAPGVYFVHLSAGGVHETRRVVRVR